MTTEALEFYQHIKQNLDALFNPFIRVVPEKDWSKIKAIWIPFLHHDRQKQLQKSEKIKLLQPTTDRFGTTQAYLTAPHENYIPYLTTFFNDEWTQEQVIDKIIQAQENILETEHIITDATGEHILRKSVIGVTKSGMMISIVTDQDNNIIDAFPLFDSFQQAKPSSRTRGLQ